MPKWQREVKSHEVGCSETRVKEAEMWSAFDENRAHLLDYKVKPEEILRMLSLGAGEEHSTTAINATN
jgi:hypothetical protein